METDIGNPIEYNPILGDVPEEKDESNDKPQREEEYYFHPSEYQPPPQYQEKESFDLFKNVEKSTWIIAFAVFLLGFFMGKTMQPVILRYSWVRYECPSIPKWWGYKILNKGTTWGILHKPIRCGYLTLFHLVSFVFWIPIRFKKQNKESTNQNDSDYYIEHVILYIWILFTLRLPPLHLPPWSFLIYHQWMQPHPPPPASSVAR